MNGILLIDKPSGWTSFDVVAKVRGIVRQIENEPSQVKVSEGSRPRKRPRVGHAGTLDPLATGLLVILVGDYCKRASEFSKMDKVYEVTMKLGITSTTGDEEGEKEVVSSKQIVDSELQSALEKYTGDIMQTPHTYSAVKINGQRAYKLAREGKEVVIEPRKVTIYSISGAKYVHPEVKFSTKVSSGTYIRSLVEDIGKELDTGAYMTGLVRSSIGNFYLSDAVQMDEITTEILSRNLLSIEHSK